MNAQAHQDRYFMMQAIHLASKGRYTTRPNPCVGCVIVKDGQIIGKGYHYQAGQPHAEVFALKEAMQALGGDLIGACAYVTLEPCSHYGRTPPCVDALIQAKISRVVIANQDLNPEVCGKGITKLQDKGIEVVLGVCDEQSRQLNLGFFKAMSVGLPYVRLKMACSLDGRIAMATGESKWITGDEARMDVQKIRAMSGAIITGSQTMLTDCPSLNVRHPVVANLVDVVQPMLVVLDRRQRLTLSDECFKNQLNRKVWLCQEALTLLEILSQLKQNHQVYDVMVEAGAKVASAFLRQDLVDELIIYQAPCLLGHNAKAMFWDEMSHIYEQLRYQVVAHDRLGEDVKLVLKKIS